MRGKLDLLLHKYFAKHFVKQHVWSILSDWEVPAWVCRLLNEHNFELEGKWTTPFHDMLHLTAQWNKLNLLYDTTCACCSVTPDRKGSAWRCGCQAAGTTVQKPGKVTWAHVRQVVTDTTWQFNRRDQNHVRTHTCMAAVNWASFSMVSSEPPLWTLVKTEVLKKYLQFWWSIWYSNSNISALMSGEERYQRQEIQWASANQ